MGYLLWSAEKVEVLFKGLSEIYLFAITYFYSSYITEEEIIDLKWVYLCFLIVFLREVIIHISIKYLRNLNLLFKKNSKRAELLTKASFFLYFRDRPKNGKGNKQMSSRKYTRQSNKTHQKRWRKLISCSTCSNSTKNMRPNGNMNTE